MARGYKSNGNLFGTDYDPGDDEEEKARLAAESAMMGAGGMTFMNTSPRGPTRKYAGAPASQSTSTYPPFLKSELLNILENADAREAQGLPRQSAPGVIDPPLGVAELQSAQSITPPVERPTAVAQEQPEAVVSSFLQAPDTPSDLGGPLLRGFDMAGGFKKDMADLRPVDPQTGEFLTGTVIAAGEQAGLTFPSQVSLPKPQAPEAYTAPMGQDATRAALGGMTLNEYLNAPAGTEGVSGLQTDPQGRMITPSSQPPVDSAVPPAAALSSFEQDSLSRQQRIGGTGSYEGDSEAREARVRASDRQSGESQSDRDTRIAQSKTTGGQTEGLSFDDARRRAEGQLAERGVRNPSASMVNALARGIQAGEPERLAELENEGAINEARLKTAEAELNRPEFEGRVYTVNGVTFAQTSRGGVQVISTGTENPEEATAKMKDFAFTKKKIEEARAAYKAGDVTKANDILTAANIQQYGVEANATEYFKDSDTQGTGGSLTQQQQQANVTRQAFDTMEEAEAANLGKGTKITIGGRNATV
jgi:hypothetical protein